MINTPTMTRHKQEEWISTQLSEPSSYFLGSILIVNSRIGLF